MGFDFNTEQLIDEQHFLSCFIHPVYFHPTFGSTHISYI